MDNLKDHFAGLAMQAIMQSEHHLEAAELLESLESLSEDIEMQDAIALLAYAQAEAMIKVRNRMNQSQTDPIIERPGEAMSSEVHDICLTVGCNASAQANYRFCPKHLREKHNEGFDDSNK